MMSWEYVAGFTDGEGYVSKATGLGKGVVIYQHIRARQVIDEMAEFLRQYDIKCQVYERITRKSPGVTLTIWDAVSIRNFLTRTLPFLIVKRDPALALLARVQKSIDRARERRRRIEAAANAYLNGESLTPVCARL